VPISTTNMGMLRNSPSASSPKINAIVMARPPFSRLGSPAQSCRFIAKLWLEALSLKSRQAS
jgi:hypothetical protein